MFNPETYIERRKLLAQVVKSGVILLLGHGDSPINHAHEVYPFRQDSTFLYYFGLNLPDFAGIIDIDNDGSILFGRELHPDDLVWTGPRDSLTKNADKVGINNVQNISFLPDIIEKYLNQKRPIHIIPAYRYDTLSMMSKLFALSSEKIASKYSDVLIQAIVNQRSSKSTEEVVEVEEAIALSAEMYKLAKVLIKDGLYEYELLAEFEKIATLHETRFAFSPTITTHGEFLHNPYYRNRLANGQLVLVDTGVESKNHYSSDITRTFPVNKIFNSQQKAVYDIVLKTQERVINSIRPGVLYRDLHLEAAKDIFNGLKEVGLTRGDAELAIQDGAHMLFFPHGIGHMLGLDTHDMRGLGEHRPGYDEHVYPTNKSGLSALRMARALKENFVITVEPGIYFIPILIDGWESEQKCKEFIDYNELKKFRNLGGIRIEDNVLVTRAGVRNLSESIPK